MKKEGMNSYSDTVNELLARYGVRFGIYKHDQSTRVRNSRICA